MPSAAEKFLKQKRERSKNRLSMEINTVAPSAAKRYGIKDDMGGYEMKSGPYTGKGPDNVTQRQNPTQRRIDRNGKEYIVDENEVVVIDSETLNDYGGPEALNQFIQQNRASRQMFNGGIPSQGLQSPNGVIPGGVTQPMARNGMQTGQSGFRQYACGGVPTKQYYGGGIPTRDRGIMSSEQKEMLKEVQDMNQYQTGGTPTRNRGMTPGTNPNPKPFEVPKGIGGAKTGGGFQTKVPGQGGMLPDNKNIPQPFGQKKTPNISQSADKFKLDKKQNVVNPNIITNPNNNTMDPINITGPNPIDPVVDPIMDPINITGPDPVDINIDPINPYQVVDDPYVVDPDTITPIDQTTDPIETPVGTPQYSASNLDEMLWNRYQGRMGAQLEAQRAGEAQRGLQAGMSDREIAGRQAIGDIGRREAMANATSDFAIDAAGRAEGRDQFNQQMSLAQNQFQNQKDNVEFQKQLSQAMLGVNAGDFTGANKIFESIGLGAIDFNKLESIQNANTAVGAIQNMIAGLGPDADPELLGMLGGMMGGVYQNMFKNLGIDTGAGVITNPDGTTVDLGNLANGIENGTLDQNGTNAVLNIGKNSQDWLDNTLSGEMFKSALSASPEGDKLMSGVLSGNESSVEEYGKLVGAYLAQNMGGDPTDQQKSILEKYDLYDEATDINKVTWDNVAPYDNEIKAALSKVNGVDQAKKIYNNLTPEQQEVLGPIEDYITKHEDYTKTINALTQGNINAVMDNFPKDKNDPIYQELLKHDTTVQEIGSSKEYEYSGGGNDAYGFSSLGTTKTPKVQEGDIVNVNGTLLVFQRMKNKNQSGTDHTVYFFKDPLTGETKKITAKQGKTSWFTE
jgi:hypothetical protein